ncbi:FecR family protein [Confluentibacter sediminis]|uniref:FecR family protein n=1 Tax=Confluentibacter sediminis TaxID=2219045 RepID=UPI000DAC6E25|nr:FecR family protein [Confluentibacter sediminis]
MKSKSEIQKLLQKFVENNCNKDEIEIITNYIRDTKVPEAFPEYKSVMDRYKSIPDIDDERTLDIYHNILKISKHKKKVKQRRRIWRYATAAAILGISLGYFFKDNIYRSPQENTPIIVNNQIKPGINKATLTLETGETIALEKGTPLKIQNVTSNGEEIEYNSDNSNSHALVFNYLSVPRGGQFYIKLSDGTRVWLNSETQLKYPVSFVDGESRQVELVYGEAYFEVSHSTEHKGSDFKVLHNQQEVQVLGTEFNIKAYKDESNIYTTLVEGKVAINTNLGNNVLSPGEQSVYNAVNNTIKVTSVDLRPEIAWKEGVYIFKNKSLKDIMQTLSRWYDMDVVFENKKLENIKFNGSLNKNQKIVDVLNDIKSFGVIKNYNIHNKTITLE